MYNLFTFSPNLSSRIQCNISQRPTFDAQPSIPVHYFTKRTPALLNRLRLHNGLIYDLDVNNLLSPALLRRTPHDVYVIILRRSLPTDSWNNTYLGNLSVGSFFLNWVSKTCLQRNLLKMLLLLTWLSQTNTFNVRLERIWKTVDIRN